MGQPNTISPFVFLDPSGRRWRRIRRICLVATLACIAACAAFLHAVFLHTPGIPSHPIVQPQLSHGTPLPSSPIRPDTPRPIPRAPQGQRQTSPILRTAWHAPWDPRSWASLHAHAQDLDAIIVEWMSLVDVEGHVRMEPDHHIEELQEADPQLGIYLVVNNLSGSTWQPEAFEELARSPYERQMEIWQPILEELQRVQARGLVLHVEGIDPALQEYVATCIRNLSETLHKQNAELWVVIPASREHDAIPIHQVAPVVDRFLAMIHDETVLHEDPGPIASQPWFERWLASLMEYAPPSQWIIGIGNYGYEWKANGQGQELAFADVMERARRAGVQSLGSYAPAFNPGFTYEMDGQRSTVWFLDATTWANQATKALEWGAAGLLVYRLGHEDPGMWSVAWNTPEAPPATIMPEGRVAHIGTGDLIQAELEEHSGMRRLQRHSSGLWEESFEELPRFATVLHSGPSPSSRHGVVLTFDDGPDPQWTPRILDILKAYHAQATFFVTGINAERYPNLIRRIQTEGHLIANHSFFHPDIGKVSTPHAAMEILSTTRLLESLTGTSPRLFRPPYLRDSLPAHRDELTAVVRAQQQDLIVLGQSIDPRDYERPGADELVARVAEQRGSGNVILLHDGGGDRSQTVEALPRILDLLASHGERVLPAWELAGLSPKDLAPVVPSSPEGLITSLGFAAWRMGAGLVWWAIAICTGLVLVRTMIILGLAAWNVRNEKPSPPWPHPVSILVPAYNEALTIGATVQSLLAQHHAPGVEILVLDDGSTDGTPEAADAAAGGDPRLRVLRLPHGGKAAALNQGILAARNEILILLDADTQLDSQAATLLAAPFHDPRVGAVSGVARATRSTTITHWQDMEYLCGFNLERRACHVLRGILVVPGAIGAWRRSALLDVGGFASDTLAEDTDATIALQRAGWRVCHQGDAVAWTQPPETWRSLLRQRFRWTFGTMQALWKHRAALGDRRLGGLGVFTMPGAWFFQVALVLLGPLLDLGLAIGLLSEGLRLESIGAVLIFLAMDTILTAFALRTEGESLGALRHILPMRCIYRPVLAWAAWKALFAAIRGIWQGWARVERRAITLSPSEG
jgi:peptidoglycan/xylan/chitin deacetylase (PgdA/CDA1 family)/spore germination protein YaaH/GT2 family glycosyltransferase